MRLGRRQITPEERRARLARRHRLAPGHFAASALEATESMVCLHATDPSTVFLSAAARVPSMTVADLERALYEQRTLVKQLAMRRTLFVFPRTTMSAALAGASSRVAGAEARRLIKEVEGAGLHLDGAAWLKQAGAAVAELLSDGREMTSTELRAELPILEGATVSGVGTAWEVKSPIGPRLLTVMSAEGRILRSTNDGQWTASRPRWASLASWLGEDLPALSPEAGTATLVERWLRSFGPGTEADIKWWLGSTLTAVRKALADLDAVEVDLGGGSAGYLLPDDLEPVAPVEPWAALLPGLDPTPMGWFERDFYLGPHKERVFDRNGNIGPTAWWDGRIVGGWSQEADGAVVVQLIEDVGDEAVRALESNGERLSAWLDGVRIMPRFPSPLFKEV